MEWFDSNKKTRKNLTNDFYQHIMKQRINKPMIKSSNSGIDLEESRRWWDCGEGAEMEWTSEGNQKRTLVLSMCDGAGAS